MPEIIGVCKSVKKNMMIIIDEDNDEIEMHHTGSLEKYFRYFKTFIGHRISYNYGQNGIHVRILKQDDILVKEFPSGQVRTLLSIHEHDGLTKCLSCCII